MTMTDELFTTYVVTSTNEKIDFLITEPSTGYYHDTAGFEFLTGCSRSDLEQASETGRTVILDGYKDTFTVQKEFVVLEDFAMDDNFAYAKETQWLMKHLHDEVKESRRLAMALDLNH